MGRVRFMKTRGGIAAALVAGAVLVAGGCGQPDADTANGKKLFSATCGGCHTLADAGTTPAEATLAEMEALWQEAKGKV